MYKPNYVKLLSLLVIALFSISFSACSDDDKVNLNDNQKVKDNLIGKWQFVWVEGFQRDDDDDFYEEAHKDITSKKWYLTLEKNGTYIEEDGSSTYEGEWTYSNRLLKLNAYDESYTVVELTDDTLILEEKEKEDGYEYYAKYTLKRK